MDNVESDTVVPPRLSVERSGVSAISWEVSSSRFSRFLASAIPPHRHNSHDDGSIAHTTMTAASTSPLDYSSYPHVVNRIICFTDDSCLPALRATCRAFHLVAAERMYSHVAVRVVNQHPDEERYRNCAVGLFGRGPRSYDPPEDHNKFTVKLFAPSTSAPASRRVPGLRWPQPAIANLEPYLDTIDLEDARVERQSRWAKEPSEALQGFDLAGRARIVRRWYDRSLWLRCAGEPFPFSLHSARRGEVMIMFVDYTVISAVQEVVSGPCGSRGLVERINHMPDVRVNLYVAGMGDALGILNVRYDPRQPDLRNGTLQLDSAARCKEVVVIFTPTVLRAGPTIPTPEGVDADRPMGWLSGILDAVNDQLSLEAQKQAYEEFMGPDTLVFRTQFVMVGAERLAATWVDSPAWHFSNSVTNTDLAAGFIKARGRQVLQGWSDVPGRRLDDQYHHHPCGARRLGQPFSLRHARRVEGRGGCRAVRPRHHPARQACV